MAATSIDIGSEIQSLQDDTKVAEQLLDGLEKRIKSMRKALANLLGGISPASILGEAEKTVKRTTSTVRKETKKAMAAFDEVERIDTADTTTTVTQSVSTTTTGGLAEDSQTLSNTDLTPLLVAFGAMLTVIGSVSLALQTGVLDSLGQIQETVAQIAGEARVPVWLETIGLVLGGIVDAKTILSIIKDLSSGGGLAKGAATIGGMLGSMGEFLLGILTSGWTAVAVGIASFVGGIYKAIVDGMDWLDGVVVVLGGTLAGAGIGVLVGSIGGPMGALIGFVAGFLTDMVILVIQNWDAVCAFFSGAAAWFYSNVIQPIGTFFTGLWEGVCQWAAECWEGIKAFFAPAIGWFSELLSEIGQTFTDIFYNIGVIVSGCWEVIKAVWGIVAGWFDENIIQPIAGFFERLWSAVSGWAIGAWADICSVFSGIATWFDENVIQPVAGFFTDLWKGISQWACNIWEDITEVFGNVVRYFKGILNGIIQALNSALSWIFGGINNILTSMKNIKVAGISPFAELRTIHVPKIPLLAQGAVLPANKPFMAVVGDQKHGTNIEAPISLIKQALAEVMAAQGGSDVVINFTGDLAQLGRVLKPVIDRENRRVGGSLVKGVV